MANEPQNNKQDDSDILRIGDIIPSNKGPDRVQADPDAGRSEKPQIPKFDLAQEIMAEQRKKIATKRGSPDKKTQSQKYQVEPIGRTIKKQAAIAMEPKQDQIIAEIVARDIKGF